MPLPSNRIPHPRRPTRPTRRAAVTTAAVAGLALAGASPGLPSAVGAGSAPYPAKDAVAHPSHETPSDSVVTSVSVVTLVTGDRVRITTFSDNRRSASILPGSPHVGATVKTVQTPSGLYVIPQLPPAEQARFDVSMFDVSALAQMSGATVPVTVTFANGVAPHSVPGLTVDSARALRAAGGATIVSGRYSRATSGVPHSPPSAWRGVSTVALPAGSKQTDTTGQRVHTLTIHVQNMNGGPVGSEVAWVQNVDNVNVFMEPVTIANGVGTVAVPEGNYAVFAGSFTRLLVKPDFAVGSDRSITMKLSDATVRPTEAVPGYDAVDTGVTVTRNSARGGGFVQIMASDRFVFRVQPVAAGLPHGDLKSTVSGTHAPQGEMPRTGAAKVFTTLAYTKDLRSGVPDSLSFTHQKSDFAIVPQQFHANGPAAVRTSDALAFAPFDFLSFATLYPVRVPSLRTVWLQGSPRLTWEQDYLPTAPFGPKPATLVKYSRYTPGAALPVSFAHGPVGPGVEAAFDSDRLGAFCLLCRKGNRLHGNMPLFSGAGTAMSGLLESPDMGSWTLKRGSDVLGSGNYVLAPQVTLPSARHTYSLEAESHPGVKSWQLSTDVSDVWTFTSGSADAVIPLLMPSYVPRTALDGSLRPGPTKLPLDFGTIGSADATVTHATVELSTDGGKHWTKATVTREDKNSFAVTYVNPKASDPRSTMSMRVSGVDAAGRTVTETAIDVYSLVS